jgi:hypothetical protein
MNVSTSMTGVPVAACGQAKRADIRQLATLPIGQSFSVDPFEDISQRMCLNYAAYHRLKIKTRKMEDGTMRVWRLA